MTDRKRRVWVPPFIHNTVNGLATKRNGLTSTKIMEALCLKSRDIIRRPPSRHRLTAEAHILSLNALDIARGVTDDIKPCFKYDISLPILLSGVALRAYCEGRDRPVNRPDAIEFFGGVINED